MNSGPNHGIPAVLGLCHAPIADNIVRRADGRIRGIVGPTLRGRTLNVCSASAMSSAEQISMSILNVGPCPFLSASASKWLIAITPGLARNERGTGSRVVGSILRPANIMAHTVF